MGIIQDIRSYFAPPAKRGEQSTLTNFLQSGYPTLSKSDVTVNQATAFNISFVYAAVNGISSDIASLKWSIYKKDANGRHEDQEHDQYELINKKPYFAYGAIPWRKALVANYLLLGDGFSETIRNSKGRPTGYRLYHKDDIEIVINYEKETKRYKIISEKRFVDSDSMIQISDLTMDGLYGYSKLGLAKNSFEISLRSDKTQNNLQKDGTFLGGVIQMDSVLNEDQLKKLRIGFKEVYGGTTGEIAVLDAGAKFEPFNYTMTMADAEFIASRKFTGEEILRFFRFPPHMAQLLDGSATKSNMEQMSLEYVNYTLRPIAVMIENELNNTIFTKRDRMTHYVKLDLNSLLRGDIESRMRMYETLYKVGATSANDILKLEDMNPVENGDFRYADLNKVPVHMVEDYYKNKTNGTV